MKYENEAKEIVGLCDAVLSIKPLEQDKIELIKKIANKIDLICSAECEDCEYMKETDRPTEPMCDPNDLD